MAAEPVPRPPPAASPRPAAAASPGDPSHSAQWTAAQLVALEAAAAAVPPDVPAAAVGVVLAAAEPEGRGNEGGPWRRPRVPIVDCRTGAVLGDAAAADEEQQEAEAEASCSAPCTADDAPLSFGRFVIEYLLPNRPVLLRGLAADWPAARDWVSADGTVDTEALRRIYCPDGAADRCPVPVAFCRPRHLVGRAAPAGGGDPWEAEEACRETWSLDAFLDYWDEEGGGGGSTSRSQLCYLKDWHAVRQRPDYLPYATPTLFRDDMLNEYFDALSAPRISDDAAPSPSGGVEAADYRFVYLGPAGSSTPLHAGEVARWQ